VKMGSTQYNSRLVFPKQRHVRQRINHHQPRPNFNPSQTHFSSAFFPSFPFLFLSFLFHSNQRINHCHSFFLPPSKKKTKTIDQTLRGTKTQNSNNITREHCRDYFISPCTCTPFFSSFFSLSFLVGCSPFYTLLHV